MPIITESRSTLSTTPFLPGLSLRCVYRCAFFLCLFLSIPPPPASPLLPPSLYPYSLETPSFLFPYLLNLPFFSSPLPLLCYSSISVPLPSSIFSLHCSSPCLPPSLSFNLFLPSPSSDSCAAPSRSSLAPSRSTLIDSAGCHARAPGPAPAPQGNLYVGAGLQVPAAARGAAATRDRRFSFTRALHRCGAGGRWLERRGCRRQETR